MKIEIILIFSVIINLLLFYLLKKKKIKNIFFKSKVREIDVENLHNIFELNDLSTNLKVPKQDAIIRSFCISPSINVVGMTSDYEAWIISTLSKISKNIFEFGTCSGKTTYLMGLNSPEDAKIISLTLNPNDVNEVKKNDVDNKISYRNIINESIYDKFMFSETTIEKKIQVIFQNSIDFDHNIFKNKMDLIFIDGGHTYSIVKNDTEKSFDMLKTNGIILWHDYVPGKKSAMDVVKYLNNLAKTKKIYKIKNTSLCFYSNN
tara:strand:- start:45 stop:830 length:786 start_codon:yes stop_codon:yes gene_type:complete